MTKDAIRARVWDRLRDDTLARFPFPPHGRIPNFAGARAAAERLLALPLFAGVTRVKVNPDAPQRHVRAVLLERGVTVLMPTPRLRAGFLELDPARIPADARAKAASLSGCRKWAREVPLDELPRLDAIVCGSVAVTRDGHRCGKGEGYSDLEYAILRELGHPPVPVATTVHPVQIVDAIPAEPDDLPLAWIATPDETIEVVSPPPPPDGIDWERLTDEDLDAMPVLRELSSRKRADP
jgi:5-formyltetrahydrofolate cyclo-ligase